MTKTVELSVARLSRMDGEGNLKAFCDLAVADTLLLKGIRVMEGKKGLFVRMPQEQGKDGQWYGTVIPLTPGAYQQISEVVLAAYRSGAQGPSRAPAGE
jgi:stage V sporulation protein G